MAHVKPNVYDHRMATCNDCHLWEGSRGICKGCGCFMTIKARAAHVSCPLGKWGSVPAAES